VSLTWGFWQPYPSIDLGDLAVLEKEVGRKVPVVHYQVEWPRPLELDIIAAILDHGSIPLITWNPPHEPAYSLPNILRGDFDDYITAIGVSLRSINRDVWLRMFHEGNGDWYCLWSPGATDNSGHTVTNDDFTGVWKHISRLFRAAGATNVQLIWCVYAYQASPGANEPTAPDGFYPGDDWIAYAGIDGYNIFGGDTYNSFVQIFDHGLGALATLTPHPLMICEMGTHEASEFTGSPASKASWITDALDSDTGAASYARVRAAVYWNAGDKTAIESSPAAVAAFSAGVSDPIVYTDALQGGNRPTDEFERDRLFVIGVREPLGD
jgi:hypothetical protein